MTESGSLEELASHAEDRVAQTAALLGVTVPAAHPGQRTADRMNALGEFVDNDMNDALDATAPGVLNPRLTDELQFLGRALARLEDAREGSAFWIAAARRALAVDARGIAVVHAGNHTEIRIPPGDADRRLMDMLGAEIHPDEPSNYADADRREPIGNAHWYLIDSERVPRALAWLERLHGTPGTPGPTRHDYAEASADLFRHYDAWAERPVVAWAASNASRNDMVRTAIRRGVPQNRIHVLTGLARTTIATIMSQSDGRART